MTYNSFVFFINDFLKNQSTNISVKRGTLRGEHESGRAAAPMQRQKHSCRFEFRLSGAEKIPHPTPTPSSCSRKETEAAVPGGTAKEDGEARKVPPHPPGRGGAGGSGGGGDSIVCQGVEGVEETARHRRLIIWKRRTARSR